MKKFDCVYAKNKLDFKKFSRSSSYQEVISYYDVIAKLVKNDVDGIRPSEYVVNSYIRKKIIKAVTESNDILYALKNLDMETVYAIKSLLHEAHEGEIEYKLIVIDSKKTRSDISEDICCLFHEIVFIEND
jgi:hypothetical protein